MKAQIFTLDVLLATVLVTVIIGMTAMHFERVYSQADTLNYFELKTLADDWSQIAVRNLLVNVDYPGRTIIKTDLSGLQAQMDAAIKTPYAYEAILSTGQKIGGSCAGKDNVASSVRPVLINDASTLGNLTVKVCI
ncbi:hypothetical protein H0N95_01165 [Candidatus Micrarchaeota archaeon]|nr:hypothetical protein [Candidatus Micrarchaeota archaeon]